jgi:hypothetical protein
MGFEQIGLARARCAAADIDGRHSGLFEEDRGYTGRKALIVSVADEHACDIGDEVAQAHELFMANGV